MCVKQKTLTRRQTLMLGAIALLPRRPQQKTQELPAVPVRPDLLVRPRDSWGAQLPPKSPMAAEPDVRFMLVHHTAGTTNYQPDQVIDQIQQVYSYQTGPEKGWPDVCYHFFIDRFGGVWEGRAGSLDGPVIADATGGNQGFAQLICLLGNYHEQPATAEMINSLERTLAWIADRYELDTSPDATTTFVSRGSNKWPQGTEVAARTISGHREMSLTVCPGDYMYPLLETEIPTAVQTLRTGQKPADSDSPEDVEVPATSASTPATSTATQSSQAPPTTKSATRPAATTTATPNDATNTAAAQDSPASAITSTSLVSPSTTSSGSGPDSVTFVAGAVVAGGTIVSIGAIAAARRHSNSQQEQGRPSAGDLGTSPTDGP